jgi:hypothetical protein
MDTVEYLSIREVNPTFSVKGKETDYLKRLVVVPWELQCVCLYDRLILISVLGGKKQIALEGFLNVMVAGKGKDLVHVNFYVLRKFITMG